MKKYTDIYLVDCENSGYENLNVNEKSLVYYFTSNYDKMRKLSSNEKEIHVYHSCVKDSLDFVLDTYLGFLARHYGRKVQYHIISKDKGYLIVCDFWRSHGFLVDLASKNYVNRPLLSDKELIDLKYKYVKVMCKLNAKEKHKLENVYLSWLRSKKHDPEILNDQLKRAFIQRLDKKDRKTLLLYLTLVGLEINL